MYHLKDRLIPVLKQSLEIGKTFIAKKHQIHSFPTLLLLKGLLFYLHKNKGYRYIFGQVGLGSSFPRLSAHPVMHIARLHYFDTQYAYLVRSRKKFWVGNYEHGVFYKIDKPERIYKLERLINLTKPFMCSINSLLKTYILLNARIIGFNINLKNTDLLNGLMLLDLQNVPESTLLMLDKEFDNIELIQDITNKVNSRLN